MALKFVLAGAAALALLAGGAHAQSIKDYPEVVDTSFVAPNNFSWATTFSQGVPNTVGPDLSSGVVPLR